MSQSKQLNSTQQAFCGGIAGLVSRFVASPLDVIKIRLQTQRNSKLWKGSINKIKYNGVINTFNVILKEEGYRAFWKGNWSAEYLYVFYGATQFFCYHRLEKEIDKMPIINSNVKYFLSGSTAAVLATFTTYPFDLLRTRFAMQIEDKNKVYFSLKQAIQTIYRTEGIKGFYHGLYPTLLSVFPYMGIMFYTYEISNQELKKRIDKNSILYGSTHTIAGSLAGLVSKSITFPLDVIRKRLQLVNTKNKSIYKLIINMMRHEGISSFYKGLLPGLLKSIPTSATTFGVYGLCLKCFNN